MELNWYQAVVDERWGMLWDSGEAGVCQIGTMKRSEWKSILHDRDARQLSETA